MIECFEKMAEKISLSKVIYKKALEEYKKDKTIFSDALQMDIHFRNEWWKHFFFKNNDPKKIRSSEIIEERLHVLKLAKFIVKNFRFFQNKQITQFNRIKTTYWTFLIFHEWKRYLIVLKKVRKWLVDFYSIIPDWQWCLPRK